MECLNSIATKVSQKSSFRARQCILVTAVSALTVSAWAGASGSSPRVRPSSKVQTDQSERLQAEDALAKLHQSVTSYFRTLAQRQAQPAPVSLAPEIYRSPQLELKLEANLPAPQRQSLARAATALYADAPVLRSKNGVLRVTLTEAYTDSHIGKDPVHLRAYNGKLVGPTLRLKRGDTLYLTLKNTLPNERWQPNMMNALNSFNTTNVHFHGLHVSPNGNSDNVLIEVGPHETQYYEVHIPKDHTPGTYWYHPHRHGSTAGDVASGMSGALIIEGGLDDIPQIKKAKDRVMVLNQIPYVYKNTFNGHHYHLKAGVVELKFADDIFGPNTWDTLGRYTTVNGVQLPVITMEPGSVERWRIVDSGQRETIHLKIVPTPNRNGIVHPPMAMYQIAYDGLAIGRKIKSSMIELWPGYRSDVLVKAPKAPGEYLLINDAAPAEESLNGKAEHLNYVGRIIVRGKYRPMDLPSDRSMAHLKLPYIKDASITGHQTAKYGIIDAGQGVAFTIDGQSFQAETARELKLGDIDEWTLISANSTDIGLVTHPFHIHVNPFEVTSIMAPEIVAGKPVTKNGVPILKEQLTHGPEWRDTVKIPGGGYVKMRTHYTDFTGTFVQHCHILDHEDQGMMQLIDILKADGTAPQAASLRSPALYSMAPDFTLFDGDHRPQSLQQFRGKPVVVFFFKGFGCPHCSLQVSAFAAHYRELQSKGIEVIGVSTDDGPALKKALAQAPCPFPIVADPNGSVFAKYGCSAVNGLEHGTFALDSNQMVIWRTIGATPYLDIQGIIRTLDQKNSGVARKQSTSKTIQSASLR
jgi:FtsP/CotA-like multicopper oxidase with cupredoxin domain/peroxiredoxin